MHTRGSTVRKIDEAYDDVIKWKPFPRYWPFVRGIHRSPVNSPHKGQWRGALVFSLICAWINGQVNNREVGDLRRHRAHYDVIVMLSLVNQVQINGTGTIAVLSARSNVCTIERQHRHLALQWRHNEHDDVTNHRRLHCLPNRLFRRRLKKTPKLRVNGLCEGNWPVTGEFPAQGASNAENVSI